MTSLNILNDVKNAYLVASFGVSLSVHSWHFAGHIFQIERDNRVSKQREISPSQILHQCPSPGDQCLQI